MSAIAGILNLNGEPVSIEQSTGMMKALEKFPANDIQTWHKDNLFLGCHAQWITPESIGEQLPFYDYERRLAITADAIIDNREELFQLLQIDREDRKKITDSQLILLAYHKWGEESPKFLVGDFAYVIWDEKEKKLFGARDFSGGRTLYFYRDDEKFIFSTTIEPLFSTPRLEKKINELWIAEFLAIPDMNDTVDTYNTAYKNIQQLPPSHRISINNRKTKIDRYIKFKEGNYLKLGSDSEYIEAFRDVFNSAVNSRLRTHLKVGAHLSGGLDSGSVVSFASRILRNRNKSLHTFSYVPPSDFKDWTSNAYIADESPYIKSTVDYVGNIKDHYLDFVGESPLAEIDKTLEINEMPFKFFGNAIWIRGIFEEAQKNKIGVLLNGGRGNLSISWGQTFNYYAHLLRTMKWRCLVRELNMYSRNMHSSRFRLLPKIGMNAFPTIGNWLNREKITEFPLVLNPTFAEATKIYEKIEHHGIERVSRPYGDVTKNRINHFNEVFSWNATNTISTKLSLYNSLWKRDPTNDSRVIDFCLSLPEDQYVQNGFSRALIRRATLGYLPDDVRLNQSIRGIQAADSIHRMKSEWDSFISELELAISDNVLKEITNSPVLKSSLEVLKEGLKPSLIFDLNFTILIRILIVYRFIKKYS
ncbi:asparagine synthase-related protein [Robertmurraya korlensis]|uniref:asparagine synthase-related protein n=1 Tax=Robertmurraya korlensis TaxID=519977 RepID=UPI000827103B|nr:asparagine synthase-related protein [Robertmurraya korlensis]